MATLLEDVNNMSIKGWMERAAGLCLLFAPQITPVQQTIKTIKNLSYYCLPGGKQHPDLLS